MEKELPKLEKELLEIPGWKELAVKLKNLPTDAEFAKLCNEFEKSLALDLEYDISAEPTTQAASEPDTEFENTDVLETAKTKTVKISIRVPSFTLAVFKRNSKLTKVAYQTIMNRALKAAALASWTAGEPGKV